MCYCQYATRRSTNLEMLTHIQNGLLTRSQLSLGWHRRWPTHESRSLLLGRGANLLMNELWSLLLWCRRPIQTASTCRGSILLKASSAAIGEQAIWSMDGVLNLVCNRLMNGNGPGMALDRSQLLLLTEHFLHLLSLAFSCLALSHHHLLLMALHLDIVSFSHLPLPELLFPHLSITPLHHLSITAEIGGRVLR